MDKLIKALQIFLKYDNPTYPTQCEHDELMICGNYNPERMSAADVAELEELGFRWSDNYEVFQSLRFGSA